MKIKNLLWSGCSFSAGNGFCTIEEWDEPDWEFQFSHEGLKKYFEPPFTYGRVQSQIKELIFPNQLGKKLNCDLIKNFSVAGLGYPIHLRKIFSYLITNPEKLDFSETVIGIQLTSLQRDELNVSKNDDIEFQFLDGTVGEDVSSNYIKNHWNPHYSVMKSLQDLLVFKGWCENMGIRIHYFGFHNSTKEQIKGLVFDKHRKQINSHGITHDGIDFPNIHEIISKLNIIEIPKIPYGTFVSEGYHDDTHYSPNGHTKIANELYKIFTTQLGYE